MMQMQIDNRCELSGSSIPSPNFFQEWKLFLHLSVAKSHTVPLSLSQLVSAAVHHRSIDSTWKNIQLSFLGIL